MVKRLIFRVDDLKDVCTNILYAVDNSSTFDNENVEILCENGELKLNVTNSEYFVTVNLPMAIDETFNATVNANLFLKLISQVTTDTIEISVVDRCLKIKGNGEYKIPIIYSGENMLHLRRISVGTDGATTATISGDILNTIAIYNSKELSKGPIVRPVQKLFYIDNEGAITFTTGACVNNFHIDSTFAVLLSSKVVKLFKLFSNDASVKFTVGSLSDFGDANLMGVVFETERIKISAILPDSTMISSVPVAQIRKMAEELQKYSVVVNRKDFSDTLGRLMLFSSSDVSAFGKFKCCGDKFIVSLTNSTASEEMFYESPIECEYNMLLNIKDLKATIDSYSDMYLNLWFGNERSITIGRGNIRNIIPECTEL